MSHKLTSYVPSVDEFVILRGALPASNILCQVTAINPKTHEAYIAYSYADGDTTHIMHKKVAFKRLIPYDVPKAVPDA